jgi:hypothetical protein
MFYNDFSLLIKFVNFKIISEAQILQLINLIPSKNFDNF